MVWEAHAPDGDVARAAAEPSQLIALFDGFAQQLPIAVHCPQRLGRCRGKALGLPVAGEGDVLEGELSAAQAAENQLPDGFDVAHHAGNLKQPVQQRKERIPCEISLRHVRVAELWDPHVSQQGLTREMGDCHRNAAAGRAPQAAEVRHNAPACIYLPQTLGVAVAIDRGGDGLAEFLRPRQNACGRGRAAGACDLNLERRGVDRDLCGT